MSAMLSSLPLPWSMDAPITLLHEENPISGRIAEVLDDGYVVTLYLPPYWMQNAQQITVPAPADLDKLESVYLYRRPRPFFARLLRLPLGSTQEQVFSYDRMWSKHEGLWGWIKSFAERRVLISLEKAIKVMKFTRPPKMRLVWADAGHSVALFLEGQPWAFIRADENDGYSKGVLDRPAGHMWDQQLFEQTFMP